MLRHEGMFCCLFAAEGPKRAVMATGLRPFGFRQIASIGFEAKGPSGRQPKDLNKEQHASLTEPYVEYRVMPASAFTALLLQVDIPAVLQS